MSRVVYPIGEQDFKSIREAGKLYVDKTGFIPELLDHKFYFLSRPRRFGKSLFLSTLEYFFRGERQLFKGLAIDSYDDWNWEPHPVIRIDLTGENYTDPNGLQHRFNEIFSRYERQFSLASEPAAPYCGRREWESSGLATRFRELIYNTAEKYGKKVVVLVDEYDKPLLDSIEYPETLASNRNELSAVYSVLKASGEMLRMTFLTGVTRFSHLNILSGLNNLIDISLDDKYAAICGITQHELETCFHEGIEALAQTEGYDYATALDKLKEYYDGYHFSSSLLDIYNPFTLLMAFYSSRIEDIWAYTGNSIYLLQQLKKADFNLFNLVNVEADRDTLLGNDPSYTNPITLLYQSGYLTIKSYEKSWDLFTLALPNHEVTSALYSSIVPFYTGCAKYPLPKDYLRVRLWLDAGEAGEFMLWLKEFFSKVTYDMKLLPRHDRLLQESDSQFVAYSILSLACGLDSVEVEETTSNGRIDFTVQTDKYIYIFEFKIAENADGAMEQIERKDYAARWSADRRSIIKIGVAFSPESKGITDYQIKTETK